MSYPETRNGLRVVTDAETEDVTKGTGRTTESTAEPFLSDDPAPVGELAEAAVLSAAMWSPDAARGLVEHLTADMFTREAHRIVFETITTLVAAEIHVDMITITDQLIEDGRLDHVGGAVAVADLSDPDTCPTVAAWKHYARIVWRDHDRRRQVADHLDALRALGIDVQEMSPPARDIA